MARATHTTCHSFAGPFWKLHQRQKNKYGKTFTLLPYVFEWQLRYIICLQLSTASWQDKFFIYKICYKHSKYLWHDRKATVQYEWIMLLLEAKQCSANYSCMFKHLITQCCLQQSAMQAVSEYQAFRGNHFALCNTRDLTQTGIITICKRGKGRATIYDLYDSEWCVGSCKRLDNQLHKLFKPEYTICDVQLVILYWKHHHTLCGNDHSY